MSDNVTVIGDENMKEQLNDYSNMLGISINDLIERYIKRGLYTDDYYIQPPLSKEEIDEIFKRNMQRDKKNGIYSEK